MTDQKEIISATQYSHFVESMIVTTGETRQLENLFGLMSETGEVAGKIQKAIRDNKGEVDVDALAKELSDVLFYTTALANLINVGLQGLIEINTSKLMARKEAGTIQGSGDDR
jgi:NTP pyrophosphatase (non-canonical NTP hydrolase)